MNRQLRTHDQHELLFGQQRNGTQIGRRETGIAIDERIDLEERADPEQHRIAVRARLCDVRGGNVASRAALSLHDDRLAEILAKGLRDDARLRLT